MVGFFWRRISLFFLMKKILKAAVLMGICLGMSSCGIIGSLIKLPVHVLQSVVEKETVPQEYEVATELSEL